VVQKFREIAENPMNENFCDKNFVIATFFRDYRHVAPWRRACEQFTLLPRPQLHVARVLLGQARQG
jgi:hypothetical protein